MIEWKRDRPDVMKSFLSVWDHILENMNPAEIPLDTTLTDLFKDQFQKSKLTRFSVSEAP